MAEIQHQNSGFDSQKKQGSLSSFSRAKTPLQQPKEQSLDDLRIQTEEDDLVTIPNKQKERIPTISFGVQAIPKKSNERILFKKPMFIAKTFELPIQKQNSMLEFISPKNQRVSSPLSIQQDSISPIKESDEPDSQMDTQELKKHENKQFSQNNQFDFLDHFQHEKQSKLIKTRPISKSSAFLQIDSPPKIMNIFKSGTFSQLLNLGTEYKTTQGYGQGPRFSTDGNIVPYSIVGKPEWFVGGGTTVSFKGLDSPKTQLDTPKQNLITHTSGTSKHSSMKIKSLIDNSQNKFDKKKKSNRMIVTSHNISKEQLISKMKECEKRILDNQSKENEQAQEMMENNQYEYLNAFKQTNQLQMFNKTTSQWESIAHILSSKLQRHPEESLLKRSAQGWRQKKEVAEVIEQAKSASHILGRKYWEASLRDSSVNYIQNQNEAIKNENLIKESQEQIENNLKKRVSTPLSHSMFVYRELSTSKGTMVPVKFDKDLEIIKYPKFPLNHSTAASTPQKFYPVLSQNNISSIPTMQTKQDTSSKITSQDKLLSIISPLRRPFSKAQRASSGKVNYYQSNQSWNTSQSQITNNGIHEERSQDKFSLYCSALFMEAEDLIIKGESKLKAEKEALINDGNPNSHIYKQFNEEELAKREELRPLQQNISRKDHSSNEAQHHSKQIEKKTSFVDLTTAKSTNKLASNNSKKFLNA